jgi:hypothetical protein
MGEQIRRHSILQKLARFGVTVTFGGEEFDLVRSYPISCVLLHIYYTTHCGIVDAVLVIEIECKCPTKDNLRAIRDTGRRRIPP